MSVCTVSGSLTDCSGTPLGSVSVSFSTQSSGVTIEPVMVSTTSNSSGSWSMALTQGMSGVFTISAPNGSTGQIVPYKFNAIIPTTTTAAFSSVVGDQ